MRDENVKRNCFWTGIVFSLTVTYVLPAESWRILAIQPFAAKSHWNFMSAVLQALTAVGHNVTVFTPFPDGGRENYTEVDTSEILPILINKDMMHLQNKLRDTRSAIIHMMSMSRNSCDKMYTDGLLFARKISYSDYDAIVFESLLSSCLTYAAAVAEDLPVIYVTSYSRTYFDDRRTVGDVSNPAAVSPLLAHYAVPKTFAQRLAGTLLSLFVELYVAAHDLAISADDPKPYDTYVPVPPSIVFTNGHYITDAARPISPNVVNVGGIHLRPPGRLPKDILEFIEDSPHGVILFTFGSTVLMSSMSIHIRTVILEVLAQLPQRILMKYEDELIDKPNNIMIRKWLPQRDILVHPKVKLFVSHGGLSGVYEVLSAGVPVLGFPIFADQYRNIDNLVEAGMAISMDISSVTKDNLFNNIVEIINNEKYKKNAEIALNIFKDRPLSPQQSVVYWTEYIIRHKGAPHLKSQALNLKWYQYFLLDVIITILIFIAIIIFIVYKVYKVIYKLLLKYLQQIKTKSE